MNTPQLSRRSFVRLGSAALLASPFLSLVAAAEGRSEPSPGQKNYPDTKKTVRLPDGTLAPALGIGGWQLASGRYPIEESEEAVRTGLSLGMRLIDTAENYQDGKSEQAFGRLIADQREQVFVVTKVDHNNATSVQSIRTACERSLRHLGTDYIDLYLLHWPVADLPPVVRAFEALKAEGLIRNWGVSNFDRYLMEALYTIPGGNHCAANQVRYSLADRSAEAVGLVDWAARQHLPLMAYSPLGSGDGVRNILQTPALNEVAAKHGVGAAAVAIAWTMRSGSVISIPATGRARYMSENARAAELTLDADDLAKLDAAFPARHIPSQGFPAR